MLRPPHKGYSAIWQSRQGDMRMLVQCSLIRAMVPPSLVPAGLTSQERGILVTESSPSRYALSDRQRFGGGRERERERERERGRERELVEELSDDSERPS